MGRPDGRSHRGRTGEIALRLTDLPRYWHTLKYLKPVQFYGRLYFSLARPRPDLGPTPGLRGIQGEWRSPARREPNLFGPRLFNFLSLTGDLNEIGWDGPQREKLWRYNQHYFDDLNARNAPDRLGWHRTLIEDWVDANPPGTGNGWEPYPTSLRVVNWIKWALSGNTLPASALQSLAVQTRWLRQRLEIHLLGNHLFANAKALMFAGLFFEGPEAETWLRKGLRILKREIPEQVLNDGGHFERSPMYHAIALEDVLDLLNLARVFPQDVARTGAVLVAELPALAKRMLSWLSVMTHPDGEFALFNDTAFGIAPTVSELEAYARRLGVEGDPPVERLPCQEALQRPSRSQACGSPVGLRCYGLENSGYIRLQSDSSVLLLDTAPIGPDYLPGHAHADTLSFEWSFGGQRLIVNGGTSRYGLGAVRMLERSTRNHSSVEVAEENSSEVWSGFRVARRAYPFDLQIVADDAGVEVSCSHDGYRRLPGRPIHRRTWRMANRILEIEDRVSGHHASVARYLLHPAVRVEVPEPDCYDLILPDGARIEVRIGAGRSSLQPAYYAPRFGQRFEALSMAVELINGRAIVYFSW